MYSMEELKAVDLEVAAAIDSELDRQNSHIELIASENWTSKAVMAAMVKHRFTPLTGDDLVTYCLDVSDQECKYDFLSMYTERKLMIDPRYFNAIDNIAI